MVKNILKSKAVNSRLHFYTIQERLKCKRSQESIGMSFNMIFSIILIIFFLVAAFVAIKYFLDYQKEIKLRLYFDGFQAKITELWSSGGSVGNFYLFEKSSPISGASALCYLDFSSSTYFGSEADKEKCRQIKRNLGTKEANFAFYSSDYDRAMKRAGYKWIEHISTDSLPSPGDNCYCIPIDSTNKIKIKISTSTENPVVKIESA